MRLFLLVDLVGVNGFPAVPIEHAPIRLSNNGDDSESTSPPSQQGLLGAGFGFRLISLALYCFPMYGMRSTKFSGDSIMKCRMVAVSLLALVVGLVAWLSLRQSEAQGQIGQEKQGWEYKVVAFRVQNDNDTADKQTKEINSLVADGWEYVGLLCAGTQPYNLRNGTLNSNEGSQTSSYGHVLFKRPKR